MNIENNSSCIEHPAFRDRPDYSVNSLERAPCAQELRPFEKKYGHLQYNKFTYKFIRLISRMLKPKVDDDRVVIKSFSNMKVVIPKHRTGTGALFLIHGGGYIGGSNEYIIPAAINFALNCGVPIFLPTYRLSPQNPYPHALNDCYNSWIWALKNSNEFNIISSKIVLGGISAGGGLAASLAQKIFDSGQTQPTAQLLIYPMLDDMTAANRELDKPDHSFWSNSSNLFGWSSYLNQPPGSKDIPEYAVASRRESLVGLPPTWIGVGTADLFLDENRSYAQRLSAAGVVVKYIEVAGAVHGFDGFQTELGKKFTQIQIEFVNSFIN